ncbi:MAG: amino acid ABC transporter permease [Candidatus Saccharibacteria bacterium]|nr:amino acid ABC transporter permease [Candidatus Saccharibacteria bacterium]
MNIIEVIFGDGRWLYLWHGLEVTLVLTVLSLILGLIIGLVVALMRLSHIAPLRWIGKTYVTIIRGTPLLVQLLIMYYVVFGSYQFMPKLIVAAIAFGINSGAYIAEIIRAGVKSIDKGQMEAARALGLSHWQAMRLVILPQALRNSLPTLISECIALLKETSVVGWIGLNDIIRGADNIRFQTATAFQSLFAAALLYLVMTSLLTRVAARIERKLKDD